MAHPPRLFAMSLEMVNVAEKVVTYIWAWTEIAETHMHVSFKNFTLTSIHFLFMSITSPWPLQEMQPLSVHAYPET